MSKNIIRTSKRENPFVMIDHRPINNPELSWQAKGLLCYLLSKPDNWTVIIADLEQRATNGRDSVKSIMKELEQKGYLERTRVRDEVTGQFSHMETIVYEVPQEHLLNPQTENPLVDKKISEYAKGQLKPTNGFSTAGKPSAGKSTPNNIDLSNNDLSNMDLSTKIKKEKTNFSKLDEREQNNLNSKTQSNVAKLEQEKLTKLSEAKQPDSNFNDTIPLNVDKTIAFWNKQDVNNHSRLGTNTKKRIEAALKEALEEYSLAELFLTIENYAYAYHNKAATHKYRLVEYMEKRGYEHFTAKKNWVRRDRLDPFGEDYTYTEPKMDRSLFSFLDD